MHRASSFSRSAPWLGVLTTTVAALLAIVYAGLYFLSGVRAYVAAESEWAKAQKQAVISLHEYFVTQDPAAYARFAGSFRIARADAVARTELENPQGDPERARQSIIAGGSDPADAPQMVALFRRFGWVGPFRTGITRWREADAELGRLEQEGARVHALALAHALTPAAIAVAHDRTDRADARLTALEHGFSHALGIGARITVRAVMLAAGGSGLALVVLGALLLDRIDRQRRRSAALELAHAQDAQLFIENAPDAILRYDRARRHVYANAAAEHVFGVTTPDLLGRTPREVPALTDVAATLDAHLRTVLETGAVAEDTVCLHASGAPRWLDVRFAPEHDLQGSVSAVLTIARDVTAQHLATAALRESEARFRGVVEQSPEAIVLHRDGRLLYANPAVTALVRVADADAIPGTSVLAFVAPESHAVVAAHLTTMPDGRWPGRPEAFGLVTTDGRRLDVEARSVSVTYNGAPAVQTHLRDVTQRRVLEEQLVYQAFHDPLTGLSNRARFRDRVEHALARVHTARAGHAEHVAVVYLDLDDFKQINDTLGHAAGDRLLQAVAARLLKATRGYDTVARLGGDEFAVLLEGMLTRADADVVVARIARALAVPVSRDGHATRVHASVGLAHATGVEDADMLLRNADVAMYQAKAAGKRGHAVFVPAMHDALVERAALETDLRTAVDATEAGGDGGFRLVYQPVVDLDTRRVLGFEALMRWAHPTRGAVPPSRFIPVAEEMGLVVALGRWALGEACRWLRAWDGAADDGVSVNVNVSGRQLGDTPLRADVTAVLAATGLRPDRLTLEVTETAVMRDMARSLDTLRALKALGVGLAVDDFGTGYSSLSYLQQLPVDVLKIDKAFVDGVADGGADAALARTVIALGQTLGLRTVAEGIETEAQRAALASLGCAYGQGYLFARPLEADAAGRLRAAAGCGA